MEGDTLELLAEIKRHAFIPSSQQTYTDAETLAVATSALRGYILPKLMARRGEFYFGPPGRVVVPVQEGVSLYRIPARAVGAKVRSARLLDRQGNPIPLATYEWDDVSKWAPRKGTPEGLTMEGAQVRLYPEPQGMSGYTLELATYVRPSALALPSACAPVLASAPGAIPGTTAITVQQSATPPGLLDASFFDVVSTDSPYEALAASSWLATFSTGPGIYIFTMTGSFVAPPDSWLCAPNTSPMVQLPVEWQPMLAIKAAATQLASLGDIGMSKAKLEELKQLEENAGPLVTPRREDASRKVSNGMNKWRAGGPQW